MGVPERNDHQPKLKSPVTLTGTAVEGGSGPAIGLVDIGVGQNSYIFRVSLPGVKHDEGDLTAIPSNLKRIFGQCLTFEILSLVLNIVYTNWSILYVSLFWTMWLCLRKHLIEESLIQMPISALNLFLYDLNL